MSSEPKTNLVIDIKSCARCGMDHPGLEFVALRQPMVVELGGATISYQFWATCPTHWEPIMMNVELTSELKESVQKVVDWASRQSGPTPTGPASVPGVKEELKFLKEVVDQAFPNRDQDKPDPAFELAIQEAVDKHKG